MKSISFCLAVVLPTALCTAQDSHPWSGPKLEEQQQQPYPLERCLNRACSDEEMIDTAIVTYAEREGIAVEDVELLDTITTLWTAPSPCNADPIYVYVTTEGRDIASYYVDARRKSDDEPSNCVARETVR